jgi:hypothetical protein
MNINYQLQTGRGCKYSYTTDRTKPYELGKAISGFANTVKQIKNSVRKHIGHSRFKMTRVTPNDKS